MLKILIADDEPWMRKCMLESIDWAAEGFEVVGLAANGMEALQMIIQKTPDIVFTDIKMPGLSGIELLKKVRAAKLSVEFIFLSGYNNFDYAKDALNYGAMGYLLKPFETDELLNILYTARQRVLQKNNIDPSIPLNPQAEVQQNKNFYSHLVFQIKSYISTHYMEDINLESIAREFKFSPNYLSRIFKEHEDIRMLDYLTRYRIDIAKEILQDARYSISDAASMVGYKNNPKYFTKIFKRLEGVTPQEYRQKKPPE